MSAPPVLCDLRAIQSPDHRGRGIGRWAYECAAGLERVAPGLVAAYLLDPDWPPPGACDELLSTGKLAYLGTRGAEQAIAAARVYHCFSPFELGRPISAVRPPFVDQLGMGYSAVGYDLIPLRHPGEYLVHPAQRRRYMARLEVLRSADALQAISSAAAGDIAELLGVDERRLHVVGTGVSRHFVPPASRTEALEAVRESIPALQGPFVLYPGGHDGRKNIEGLITAFSRLPPRLVASHQLVVVGDLPPLTANHYRHLARLAGVEHRLVLTGFVSDDSLLRLYQATDLFVFPSWAEGYGLPIAEALACGAVAAVSDLAPFDELVTEKQARFDPFGTDSIAATLERCLTNQSLRAKVLAAAPAVVASWDEVASRAAAILEQLAAGPRRPWSKHTRVAVVSPFPPLESGVAGYSAKLVEAMVRRAGDGVEIDCFIDGRDRYPVEPLPIGGSVPADARAFEIVDGATGSYEHVVYVLGNSEYHQNALAALRRRPGSVISHDVRLTGLMTFAASTRGAVPGGLQHAIARAYPSLPPDLGENGSVNPTERDRYGLLMLRDVLAHTDRLFVSSFAALHLAELDAGPMLSERLAVLPFAISRFSVEERQAVEAARRAKHDGVKVSRKTIASFGIVDPSKRPETLIAAVAELVRQKVDVELYLVGGVSASLAAQLGELGALLGVAERVHITGSVAWEEYLRLLGEADLGVQLRAHFFGESSGAVSECLSAGVPTVVSNLGWMAELPSDAVVKVPHEVRAKELADVAARLLGDDGARTALGEAGERYASGRTFDVAADALLEAIGL